MTEQASRLGAAKVVRAMERLGEMLVEMRHAPDPRLLLEVALVQLTHERSSHDLGVVLDRVERLEAAVAAIAVGAASAGTRRPCDGQGPARWTREARRASGTRVSRTGAGAERRPVGGGDSCCPSCRAAAHRCASRTGCDVTPPAAASTPPRRRLRRALCAVAGPAASSAPSPGDVALDALERAASMWSSDVVPSLKPLVRAIFSVPKLLGVRDGALALGAPNDAHRARCEQHRGEVEAALAKLVGAPVRLAIVVEGSLSADDHLDHPSAQPEAPHASAAPADGSSRCAARLRRCRPRADDDIDLDDLVDVPPESVVTPLERLAQAFPGSKLMDERP